MKRKLSIFFIIFTLTTIHGVAMKPGPQEKIIYKDQGFLIESNHKSSSPDETSNTKVYSQANSSKILWTIAEYFGQRQIKISPDGQEIIVFGNVFFGSSIKEEESENILQIFSSTGNIKNMTFEDITKSTLAKDIKTYNLSRYGGGWVEIADFLTLQTVDWKKRTITFVYKGSPTPLQISF